ncbi:MAG TPA: zf-HC2 domain-containing protein [Gemmatimonadales bacterium]|nr:zf-HC2 domain-containing protein [Gemmatimonadales bacterium]
MTCETLRDRLDQYVAGSLDTATAREIATHLAGCEECRADEAAARFLAPRVAALPRIVAPDRPLWDGIASRLEPRRRLALRTWLPLAAALAIISAGGLLLVRSGSDDVGPARVTAADEGERAAYRTAAADLQAALLESGRLTGTTASALRRDVLTLDDAIDETARALQTDPANPVLQQLHLSALRRKLETLRRAAAHYTEL